MQRRPPAPRAEPGPIPRSADVAPQTEATTALAQERTQRCLGPGSQVGRPAGVRRGRAGHARLPRRSKSLLQIDPRAYADPRSPLTGSLRPARAAKPRARTSRSPSTAWCRRSPPRRGPLHVGRGTTLGPVVVRGGAAGSGARRSRPEQLGLVRCGRRCATALASTGRRSRRSPPRASCAGSSRPRRELVSRRR